MLPKEVKSILIVESFPLFKQALLKILTQHPVFVFQCSCIDHSFFPEFACEPFRLDLIIMDISPSLKQNLPIIKKIKKLKKAKVLAVDVLSTFGRARQCFFNLADGYIGKNACPEEFNEAVQTILKGKKHIPPKLKSEIWNWFMNPTFENPPQSGPSKREMDVLKLIVQEFSTPEIAEKLFISKCTVETHRINLLHKFKVKNTAGLVREAVLQYQPDLLLS